MSVPTETLYRAYLLATIVGVVGACAGVFVLIWQTVLLRRNTKAAEAAANAARSSALAVINAERAWIVANVERATVPDSHGSTVICFSVRCVNKGKTPAFLLEMGNHGLVLSQRGSPSSQPASVR